VPDPLVIVVTGASSGIGEAAARRLAREPGARLVLVARREDRLRALAGEIGPTASRLAVDVLEDDAPARLRAHLEERHDGALHLLVNNAGSSWRARFDDGGWANVQRHMALNFDAVVRVTEALLPLLRASAPSAIVNVASVAGRVGRPGAGAYSASKFALAGWSESLYAEERQHGVHVGLVLPGFIATEGFPAEELRAKPATRWLVSTPDKAAEAIVEAGLRGRAERYVPRPWALIPALRHVAPGLLRRFAARGGGAALVTRTGETSPPSTRTSFADDQTSSTSDAT
jgi:short-subunit dehydrogenase